MPTITVNHQQQRFSLQGRAGSSLLEQLYELPLPLRKACRNGACGVCRCKLSAGQIDYGHRVPTAPSQPCGKRGKRI
ncbi:2Fe-2S iron-sulfur cluster-binding protein [Dasania marina]|uniref:2Fe-2S iron-sulfur cluster-binding protein n=1 Tax=Dasania marina TaxID=471499 RepID=UPI00036D0795